MRFWWGELVTRSLRRSGAPPGGDNTSCQELADEAYQKALRKRGRERKMPPVERRKALMSLARTSGES
jgi:hypothetical protein